MAQNTYCHIISHEVHSMAIVSMLKKPPRMLALKQRGLQALCPSCFYAKYYKTQTSVVYDMRLMNILYTRFLPRQVPIKCGLVPAS